MRSVSDSMRRGTLLEVLRWICVLPAAILGELVAQFLVGAIVRIAGYGGWQLFGDSSLAYPLRLSLFYVLPNSGFVVVGAKMAPRYQRATTAVLSVLGIGLSLMIHVIGQHLAGNPVGLVNYTHFAAESTGVLGGAACIFLQAWRRRRSTITRG